MTVQASAKSLLVEVVGNETDAAAEHEQSVEDTHLHVIFRLLGAERTAVAHQIDEAYRNTAVDVQDEVVLFGGRDGFDGNGVVEHLARWEPLLDKLFYELDTKIRVVARLDFVTDARDYTR